MHFNDETAGHVPADLTPEIDHADLSDEALDRPKLGNLHCYVGCNCSCTRQLADAPS